MVIEDLDILAFYDILTTNVYDLIVIYVLAFLDFVALEGTSCYNEDMCSIKMYHIDISLHIINTIPRVM